MPVKKSKAEEKTMPAKYVLPPEQIAESILMIRGEKVIVDADLSRRYGAKAKRLNEPVKRNLARFPSDFVFQFTAEEPALMVSNCDHLRSIKISPSHPNAVAQHR